MATERLPKQIPNWVPERRRKGGRSRKDWKEDINTEMQDRGLEEDEWNDQVKMKMKVGKCRRPIYIYIYVLIFLLSLPGRFHQFPLYPSAVIRRFPNVPRKLPCEEGSCQLWF